ncbi:MAG: recombination protein RecR [Lachnospiraceae bacterium]|nr:recombination protein RecR [Lachnospiraceae bacterium]
MINSSKSLQNLINEFSNLPGIGKKSAARISYYLANAPKEKIKSLTTALNDMSQNIKKCSVCFSFSDNDICDICKSDKRDKTSIMVVENERDMEAYENIGEYKGLYHVLGGALSPLLGIGPNELKIKELIARLSGNVNEVILATNSSIEGETTATYIAKLIKPLNIKVTRIAAGVPVGGDIENIDDVTLMKALNGRQII